MILQVEHFTRKAFLFVVQAVKKVLIAPIFLYLRNFETERDTS